MSNTNINYISLGEAAKLTNYSQEYISLLCRQKKLEGTKIGRNWVTTKEWIENYVNKTKGSGENIIPVKIKNIKKQSISDAFQADESKDKVLKQKEQDICLSDKQVNLSPHTEIAILAFFRRMILATFVVGVFGIGFVLFSSHISFSVRSMLSEVEKIMAVVSFDLNPFLDSFNKNQTEERAGVVAGVKTFVDKEDGNGAEGQKVDKGIIIIPLEGEIDSEENQKLIEKLSSSFSDNVDIKPSEDGVSGVITSQKNPDDSYLYLNIEKIINKIEY